MIDKKKAAKPGKRKCKGAVDDPPRADIEEQNDAVNQIRADVERRVAIENETLGQVQKKESPKPLDVRGALARNEVGDGELFCDINRDKFIYNASSGEWLYWDLHYWRRDIKKLAKTHIETTVVQKYCDEIKKIDDQIHNCLAENKNEFVGGLEKLRKNFFKRITRLRTEAGRNNCLSCACTVSNSVVVENAELDNNKWFLGCPNGVVDLRTAELRSGQPADLITKVCGVEYLGIDAPALNFERFLHEIFSDRTDIIEFIQRLLGYCCTGLTSERIMPVFVGIGWNGKGTLLETITTVLGDYSTPIPSDMLLDSGKYKSASGPSPDIMMLKGLRLALASETDSGRRFSASRVKWLTGGDSIVGRLPFDKQPTVFRPTHKLILMTNNEPNADSDDFALWERMALVRFPLSFVDREPLTENERPRDKELPERLLQEGPGILAWLVRGCLAWQREGLNPPEEVRKQTAKYRRSLDNLQDFLDERCIIDTGLKESAKALYDSFCEFWEENIGKKIPSQVMFGKWMTRRFEKERTGARGSYEYYGVAINDA